MEKELLTWWLGFLSEIIFDICTSLHFFAIRRSSLTVFKPNSLTCFSLKSFDYTNVFTICNTRVCVFCFLQFEKSFNKMNSF